MHSHFAKWSDGSIWLVSYALYIPIYSWTSMARTSLRPWKFVRDVGSSSHWGLIMAPVQEANSNNLEKSFQFSTQWLYVECTQKNHFDEAILMSTHNIQFHDKIRKNPEIFVFLSYWKDFVGTEKRVRIIHGKRAIWVRAIEVILYMFYIFICPSAIFYLFNAQSLLHFYFWSWNIFYGHYLPSADSRRAVVSFWRKNVHNTG